MRRSNFLRSRGKVQMGILALAFLVFLFPSGVPAQYSEQEDARPQLVRDDFFGDFQEFRDPVAVQHYVIEAELFPETHQIQARAQIRFQALEDVYSLEFELNNNLFPTNIENEQGDALSAQRGADNLTLSVSLGQVLPKDQTATITFEYEGVFENADYSPAEGVRLAYVGEEGSYLLYPARWFPLIGYPTSRYTAEIGITVPSGFNVVFGGKSQPPAWNEDKLRFSFSYQQPQLAGSLAVVPLQPEVVNAEGLTMNVYFSGKNYGMARTYGEETARMMNFFSGRFGLPPQADLSIVEIDDRSLGGYSAPGVVFLASRAIGSDVNYRLLAHEISQQWWRALVSPATQADLWLDHGMATYSEALYLEHLGGEAALEERMREMSVEALTHDTVPISAAGSLTDFSPQFKSIVHDKSGVVLHMLRWVIGDEAFFQALRQFSDRFAFRSATTEDFRMEVERASSQDIRPFFLQWIESTGASNFEAEYVVYRVPDGFKVVGKIEQDMDTFSMPVELEVETDGDPVTERVQVMGRSSEFSIETFGKPRRVLVDPNNRVLKYNDSVRLRVAIARGEMAVEQRDYSGALEEYQQALDISRISSLAHYRVGEVFFLLRNYQSAANAFREALNGDLEPLWTEVWSHIYLGQIFDVTGQRDRAVNEYQQAVRTKDDTQGAQAVANEYLQQPYQRGGRETSSPG